MTRQGIGIAMKRTESLKSLLEATLRINRSVDLSDVLRSIVSVTRELLSVERGTLYVVDHERGELWSTVLDDPNVTEIRLPFGRGVAGNVALDGKTVLLNNPYTDSRFDGSVDQRSGFRTRNMLVAPLQDPVTGQVAGVLQLLNKIGGDFCQDDAERVAAVSAHLAVTLNKSVQMHRMRTRQVELQNQLERRTEELIQAHQEIRDKNQAMSKELGMAVLLQQTLLPEKLPRTERIWFETLYRPSTELSGDLFDLIMFDDHRFGLVLVDVMGHGVASAMVAAMFKMAFHFHASEGHAPSRLVGKMNRWLIEALPSENRMMTAVYLYLDCERLTARFTVAGHPHPRILRRTSREIELVDTGDIPLGMIPDFGFHEKEIQLQPGDRVLLFTDGLYECEDPEGIPMGMQTADAILKNTAGQQAQVVINELWNASCSHRHEQSAGDDVTLVVFDVATPDRAPSPPSSTS